MTRKRGTRKTVCISDRKDMDGVGAAALVKCATDARCVMATTTGLWKSLYDASVDDSLESLYVCDFGLSRTNYAKFAGLAGLICERAEMTYVDHHTIEPSILDRLRDAGVSVVHSELDCAAVLTHELLAGKLPAGASFLAACAAMTDYKDDGPLGSKLIGLHDRQFVMFEAMVANQHIDAIQDSDCEMGRTVSHLAKMGYPHQIPGAVANAKTRADLLVERICRLEKDGERMSNLAYVEVPGSPSGIVNSLLGMSGLGVAVAYSTADDGWCRASVRGRTGAHLGKLVDSVATSVGGRGGGHRNAAGAAVPPGCMGEFLARMDQALE